MAGSACTAVRRAAWGRRIRCHAPLEIQPVAVKRDRDRRARGPDHGPRVARECSSRASRMRRARRRPSSERLVIVPGTHRVWPCRDAASGGARPADPSSERAPTPCDPPSFAGPEALWRAPRQAPLSGLRPRVAGREPARAPFRFAARHAGWGDHVLAARGEIGASRGAPWHLAHRSGGCLGRETPCDMLTSPDVGSTRITLMKCASDTKSSPGRPGWGPHGHTDPPQAMGEGPHWPSPQRPTGSGKLRLARCRGRRLWARCWLYAILLAMVSLTPLAYTTPPDRVGSVGSTTWEISTTSL